MLSPLTAPSLKYFDSRKWKNKTPQRCYHHPFFLDEEIGWKRCFISSLGLLSISLFDIRQRYREIGLRKVNGAQATDIYPLLIKKYLSVLAIATLISIPVSWGAITLYLQDFAHKAPITFDLFAIAVIITAIISLLIIIWQIHKAANVNPAEVVKTE